MALRMGWYKPITTGLPLNVCKTIFGALFYEGVYTKYPIEDLLEEVYKWGVYVGGSLDYSIIVDRIIKANQANELDIGDVNRLMEEFEEIPF